MSSSHSDLWYVELPNGVMHRVTLDQLDEAFQGGYVDGRTKVYAEAEAKWIALREIIGDDEPARPPARPANRPHAASYSPPPPTLRPVSAGFDDEEVDLAPFKRSAGGWLAVGALAIAATATVAILPAPVGARARARAGLLAEEIVASGGTLASAFTTRFVAGVRVLASRAGVPRVASTALVPPISPAPPPATASTTAPSIWTPIGTAPAAPTEPAAPNTPPIANATAAPNATPTSSPRPHGHLGFGRPHGRPGVHVAAPSEPAPAQPAAAEDPDGLDAPAAGPPPAAHSAPVAAAPSPAAAPPPATTSGNESLEDLMRRAVANESKHH